VSEPTATAEKASRAISNDLGMWVSAERLDRYFPGYEELIAALKLIESYGKHHGGCCPYGCDTPAIATEALRKAGAL
jgi:hypothetical protein